MADPISPWLPFRDGAIRYDDPGFGVCVEADVFERRDGAWSWSASVAGYSVVTRNLGDVLLFASGEGDPPREKDEAKESGPRLAPDEATALAECEAWIADAVLVAQGLKHPGVPS